MRDRPVTISFVIVLLIFVPSTLPIVCNALDYGMDEDISNADASLRGEDVYDRSGWSVAGAGDVKGDGGKSAGQTYLIFGKVLG